VFKMPGTKDARLAMFREILLKKKRKLWNELREEIFRNTGEDLHTQFEIAQDPAEQGLIGLLEDTGLAVADIRRQELTRMDEAMNRLEKGTYGTCEECGVEIDERRIAADPLALCCLDCQKRREGPSYPPGAKY
jgi:DnaK suppressor protein